MRMVTIKRYLVPSQAGLDKSVLDAEGIPAFVADENSAALVYGTVLGGVRLQVQDEDVDRAREILSKLDESNPLPDDFVPPEEPQP
jgi:hypothetical protein